ncbi:DUF5750 family protein [Methanobrevibacter sp.]|uniref:DUF5750 family protein n=1 Tax=Methanobrevibacter sp. TaxID=66852 RepID=UPI00386AAD88
MIVKISDYGDEGSKGYVEYHVSGLSSKQMEFLNGNLAEETCIDNDIFRIKMYFEEALYPFQSDVAKIRMDDFIAREEIEMNVFLSSFLDDMQ